MNANLSVIIPTLNEEGYLGKALESLSKQTLLPLEIIVADAKSTDKTRQIANSFNCKVVDSTQPERGGPAVARNKGAEAATGERLLFIDADVILPPDFIEKSINELERRNLDIGAGFAVPITNNKLERMGGYLLSYYLILLEKISPRAGGYCIFSTKKIHNQINGFDEKVYMAEDHDYVKRASKVGRFGALRDSKVYVSIRRFKEEGTLKTTLKYLTSEIFTILFGKNTKKLFNFEFGKHEKKN